MCGRYRLKNADVMTLAKGAAIDFASLLKEDYRIERDRYNVAPSQFNPVVLKPAPDADPTLAAFRWGLIPPWARDFKSAYSTINARSETAATLRTFAEPFKNRHCLVPAGGWYEWRQMDKVKQPYLLTLPDQEPFFFAGLWQAWKPKVGEIINSFTILTADANRHIRALHDRMPVIVPQARWMDWLAVKGEAETSVLLKGPVMDFNRSIAPAMVPVSRAMSNAKNEGAEAAAVLPMDPTLDLSARARVLDTIEQYTSTGVVPTAEDIQQASGLTIETVQETLEDLKVSERIIYHMATDKHGGDETGWLIAGATPPDGVPPLNPL